VQKAAITRINSYCKARKIFLVLLCLYLLASTTLLAQTTDSLERELTKSGITNKLRLELYKDLCGRLATRNFDKAISLSKDGVRLAAQLNDSISIGKLYSIMGEACYFRGNHDVGVRYIYDAIAILEDKDKAAAANCFNNLGKLYRKTKELDKSIAQYDKAMELFRSVNDSAGMQMIWNESGVPFEYKGDYQEALRRYRKSLELARARKDRQGEGYALNFISGALMMQKKYPESLKYMEECLQIRREIKDTFALAIAYADKGSLLIEMKEYDKAMQSLEQSNALATLLKYPGLLANNYQLTSNMYKAQGQFEKALEFYTKATQLKDSIFSIAKSEQIADMDAKYETGKKEQQIQLQQAIISRRNYMIGGISLAMVLSLLLGISVYRRRKLQAEARMQEALLAQQEKASHAILEAEEKERQRIGQDLHDGVGQIMSAAKINLSVFLQDIIVPNEEEKIRVDNILSLIDESCKEVRAVSHSMMPNALLKAGLASAVREFLNRIDSKVLEVNLYTEGLDERLDTTIETVLYRVIQESVNNVIKHAGANRLDISIIKDEDGLSATIEDNGKGFDTSDMSIRNGIGLKNIETRITYLKGEVTIDSTPGHGTVTMINIAPKHLDRA
jgi:two-component system NarL family sensor kinase